MEKFEEQLSALLNERRDHMKAEYDRVLPVGELLFNRFDKAAFLHAGEGSSVYDASVIMGDVRIGAHVWVGPFTLIEGANAPVTIGDYASINTGVSIFTHDSTKHQLSGGICPFEKGPVTIGHNSVIGSQSVINYGVTIGHHCLVGANSFVKNDVPDYGIVAGTPARLIGKVVVHPDGTIDFAYFSNKSANNERNMEKND